MFLNILIVGVFVLCFALNIFADRFGLSKLIELSKPLLVPLIMLFYVINASDINVLLILALFFGFVGDVALLGKKEIFTYIGMAAFFTGHIFYSVTFVDSVGGFKTIPMWFYLFIIPYVIYGYIMMKFLWDKLVLLRIPMVIYMCALFTMSFTSLCRISTEFSLSTILPFIGSLFFITSDSCLAYQMTPEVHDNVKNKEKLEVIIMVTYIIAQIMIMLGFLI